MCETNPDSINDLNHKEIPNRKNPEPEPEMDPKDDKQSQKVM